jgi:uncharacterized coiled-coil DUF342 family protein
MFDNGEIKSLRQDVDALSEQISLLIETLENRHMEVMARLDVLEEKVGEIRQEDIDEIKGAAEEIRGEVSDLAETMQSLDEHITEAK